MSLVPNRPTRMARPARRPRTADGDPSGLLRNVPPPQVRWPRASGGAREGRQGRRNDTARVEDESPGEEVDPGPGGTPPPHRTKPNQPKAPRKNPQSKPSGPKGADRRPPAPLLPSNQGIPPNDRPRKPTP